MMSDVRYEIKTELKLRYLLSDLKYWLLINPGSFTNYNWSWFLVDPVDDEDWRDRPRTDPSSISDLGTGLGVILVLKRLDFSPTLCRDSWSGTSEFSSTFSRLLCVQLSFSVRSFDLDFRSGYLCPVSRLDSGSVIRTRIRIRNSFVSRIWT